MKRIVLFLLVSLFCFGSANAITIQGQDFEEVVISNSELLVGPSNLNNIGLGYHIWADDTARRNWNIAWKGNGTNSPLYRFSGEIYLTAGNSIQAPLSLLAWETTGTNQDRILAFDSNYIDFRAFATTGYDGISFTLLGNTLPSFLGFDLGIRDMTGSVNVNNLDLIKIGNGTVGVESYDFAIAAPVPEPGTLLLLGSGLVGLAYLKRRKKA